MGWGEQVRHEAQEIVDRACWFDHQRIHCDECRQFVGRAITGRLGGDRAEEAEWLKPTLKRLVGMGVPRPRALALLGHKSDRVFRRQVFPFQRDDWWLDRQSGTAHVRIRKQCEVLGRSEQLIPPRPRGRPRVGHREDEVRGWASDVRWWLGHVAGRRLKPERRWGHLRRVLREMFPRRVSTEWTRDLPAMREWIRPVVEAIVAAAGSDRRDKPIYGVRDVALVLSILLVTTRASSLGPGVYTDATRILRALTRRSTD